MEYQPARSEYKKVWSALSTTEDQAKLHVIGVIEEASLEATGEETLRFLQDSVGIRRDDVVLEIGCGIGRVGKVVAPLCRKRLFVLRDQKCLRRTHRETQSRRPPASSAAEFQT